MRIVLVFAALITLSAVGADSKRIGEVKEVEGNWCRKGTVLKKGDIVNWEDDIRYCSRPVVKEHLIKIVFDREHPYERTYGCSTAGICEDAKLWLQGAYKYGEPISGQATPLISTPKLRGPSIPDAVITVGDEGAKLPNEVVSAIDGESVTICSIPYDQPTDCTQSNPTQFNPMIRVAPGLYGVYRLSRTDGPPNALLLVVPVDSPFADVWYSVPAPFREDSDPDSIRERRLFLLDLYKTTKR